MNKDIIYIERSNGIWEAWCYSDGERYWIANFTDLQYAISKFKSLGYEVIVIK